MPKIQNITPWNFTKMAEKEGKKLMSFHLKDNMGSAKILWNENAVDCYIVKNGQIKEAKGTRGTADDMTFELAQLLDKMSELAEPGVNVMKDFVKVAFSKNVK